MLRSRHWPYGETRDTATTYDPINSSNILGYAAGIKAGGVTKFGTRWYDTTTGRFTQQDNMSSLADPSNGNRYAYAGDDPVINIDPTGKSWGLGPAMAGVIFDVLCSATVTLAAAALAAPAGGRLGSCRHRSRRVGRQRPHLRWRWIRH